MSDPNYSNCPRCGATIYLNFETEEEMCSRCLEEWEEENYWRQVYWNRDDDEKYYDDLP